MASMYQYRVARIWQELQAQGKDCDRLTVNDLIPLDQYHYLSVAAVDAAAERLQLTQRSHVLDIGSGVGGTVRYLAWKYGCQVTGLELQPHLHEAAVRLTQATNLEHQVTLYEGNFLQLEQLPIAHHRFQHWISLLVFLHIGDRDTLFTNCAKVLKPGGTFYIEDYFERQPLTVTDEQILNHVVSCPSLPTLNQYQADLEKAGFVDLEFQEVTDLWLPWVQDRVANFTAKEDYYTRIHGAIVYQSFSQFYQEVAGLFARGNVGGLRIVGRLR